jgi:radical SAM protein with 4Fe4S-binding SPASM domain
MGFTELELSEIYKKKVQNLAKSLQEYKEKKLILESRPSKAIIELTENCGFKCTMCSQATDPKYAKYNPAYNMPLQIFDHVAETLFPYTYFVDLRGFGETTILPYWPEVLRRLENHPHTNWHLVTNLALPKDDVWEKMIQAGFMLGFSCDGATQETFEKIRVRSRFPQILHNLKVVSDAIKKYDKGYLYFIVTVQKNNIHELPDIMALARKHDVPEVQFKIVRQFDSYRQHDEMVQTGQKEALRKSIDRSLDLAIDYRIRLNINDQELLEGLDSKKLTQAEFANATQPRLNFQIPQEFDKEIQSTYKIAENKKCFKPFSFTYVSSDGRVGTCNHMMSPHILEMGSLNYLSFDEIWNGDEYQMFRKSLLTEKPMDPRCRWCFKHRLAD